MQTECDGLGTTIELKSASTSLSRSPTPCRFKHSHLTSRMSQGERRMSEGERLVARAHAHPRSMGPEMDSLLYAILGSVLRNCLAQLSTLVLVLRASGRPTQFLCKPCGLYLRMPPEISAYKPNSGRFIHFRLQSSSGYFTKCTNQNGYPLQPRRRVNR